MEKGTKILFAIWMLLAIAAFVSAFYIPVFIPKLIALVFGGLNMLTILSWVIETIGVMIAKNKITKTQE